MKVKGHERNFYIFGPLKFLDNLTRSQKLFDKRKIMSLRPLVVALNILYEFPFTP